MDQSESARHHPDQPPAHETTAARVTRRAFLGLAALAVAGCSGKEHEPTPTSTTEQRPSFDGLPELEKSGEINVIRDGEWTYMPGTTVVGDTLRLERTGQAVLMLGEAGAGRPARNPEYQPNPPLNLYGTHIEMSKKGDVGLKARLTDVEGPATVSFLGSPSVRYDERINRMKGVDVTVDDRVARIAVYDGTSDQPTVTTIDLPRSSPDVDIALSQSGNELHVNVNGHTVELAADILDHQVWFGLDAKATVDQFTAYPVNSNRITPVDMSKAFDHIMPSGSGLAATVTKHHPDKRISTAVDLAELMTNPEYTKFVLENFNAIETEMLAKFQALQPEEGRFDFSELDALVDFANKHNLAIHGHALVFTEAYPHWLYQKLSDPDTAADEARALLHHHITTVVSRYDGNHGHGKIEAWDVVNEPFDPEDDWAKLNPRNIWGKKLGEGYIAEAFRAAHAANPAAKLYLNEWGIETDPDRRRAVIDLVTKLREQGVPIDGVGLQAHFDEETLDESDTMDYLYSDELPKLFEEFRRLGLLVRISEASVAENGDPQTQGDVYGMLMEAAVNAPNCTGFNVWGASNGGPRNAYFTGDVRIGDPGDDAPATQPARGGPVRFRQPVIRAINEALQ